MSTRLTITLPDSLHDPIARIAEIQDRPKSKVITELLQGSAPYLERIAQAMEAVKYLEKDLPETTKNELANAADQLDMIIQHASRKQENEK